MSRSNNTGTGAAPGPGGQIHQAFSWVEKGVADVDGAEFAALTVDVCRGIETCLQLMHVTDISVGSGAGDEDPPILGVVDKERLLLLAQAAAHMLGDRANMRIDDMNKQLAKAAQKRSRA
jgi:hypothetical protein